MFAFCRPFAGEQTHLPQGFCTKQRNSENDRKSEWKSRAEQKRERCAL
jgi:hypothetical protein